MMWTVVNKQKSLQIIVKVDIGVELFVRHMQLYICRFAV